MRVMTKEQSEMLDKLLQVAFGDARLVNEAIREAARARSDSTNLEDIVNYILEHRSRKRAA